jgi:hypothetical protein
MNFYNGTHLKLTYIQANGSDPDTSHELYLGPFPGQGLPRQAYAGLKGSATSMDWPQGTAAVLFDVYFPFGPNLETDSINGQTTGIRSWQITAEPSHISGQLELAFYLASNYDNSSPDSVSTFSLGSGSWSTGDLPIHTGDFSPGYYRDCLYRFVPGPLIIPLGV